MPEQVTIKTVKKPIPLKKEKIAISDNVIAATVANEDFSSIIEDTTLTDAEKITILQDKITIQESKLRGLKQQAAIGRCLDTIKELRQYLSLLHNGGEIVDDEEDMDVFDLISLNAKQVAAKRSNSLIVTGDAGVGKTRTVIEAIKFLNPVKETEVVDEEDLEDEDGEETPDWVFSTEIKPEGLEGVGEDENDNEDKAEEDTEIEEVPAETSTEEIPSEEVATEEPKVQPAVKVKKQPPLKKGAAVKVVKTNVDSRNHVESGYYIASGTCTSAALYELLFIHRKKLLVFDDFDSILKDDDCINLLKAALDTYPIRELSKMTKGNSFNSFGMSDGEMWDEYEITGKVPNQFKFSGNIIFISNIHEDKFDKALISRSLHVEVRLSRHQIIERMHKLMLEIRPEVPVEWKLEALHHLEFLTSNFPCKFDLNLRELIHAIDYKTQYPDDVVKLGGKDVLIWKQLLKKRIVKSKRVY